MTTKFVTAVNSRNEKQRVPASYVDHPVLGKNLRLPESAKARPTKAELLAQIEQRNAGRPEADLIIPASEKNGDLEAALAADDQRA